MVRRPSRHANIGQWIPLHAALTVASLIVSNGGDNLARWNKSFGFEFLADRPDSS
jgi:hypothetical protein